MIEDAKFVLARCKSDRSIGVGTASVRDLVRAAALHGAGAIALTDVGNMYGQVELHHAAREAGIRAITGVELRGKSRLVLLARDRAGYESLCRIVTSRKKDADVLDCDPRGVFFLGDDASLLHELTRRGVSPGDVRTLRSIGDVDAVMIDASDRDFQRLLARIHDRPPALGGLPLSQLARASEAFPKEALDEARRIAEACTLDLTDAPRVVPFVEDADAKLAAACAHAKPRERLERELAVIRELGLAPYFLGAKAITDHMRAEDIAFAGRGSAASSLVCFALGITSVDPIANGLHFERFVRRDRKDPPDIDLDVASHRRDEVIDWVFRTFGRDRVAMVSTHRAYRRRGAYRDALKAFGMRREDIDRFCARIPEDDVANGEESPAPVAMLPYHVQTRAPLIERLVGKLQHVSVHPGGVVIADAPLVKYVPLERAPKGVVITQYDLGSIAKMGLLKIDLLGNRALSALDALPKDVPERDEATTALLREANTIGCFQIETAPMRNLLRKIPVHGPRDLANVLALVRPGPSTGDAKSAFIRGEDVLLFEEDIISLIARTANVSLEQADAVRAAIVAGDSGVKARLPPDVWRDVSRFAAYSFNRAHAMSYAEIAWRSAYTKAHHPVAFACGVLGHYGGAYPLRTVAADFARNGVRILRPDVNRSQAEHLVDDGSVRLGLGAIKHVTKKTVRAILEERPFADMRDFFSRIAPAERELRALVLCGACDDLAPLSARTYPIAHEDLLAARSLDGFVARAPSGPTVAAYQALVRIRNEVTFLDMHPSEHPMRVLRAEAAVAGATPIAELREGEARIAGIVAASRRIETRGKRKMQFVTIEDETGVVEVVLLPGVYASLGDPVTNAGPFLIDGVVEDGALTVKSVIPFHRRPSPWRRSA